MKEAAIKKINTIGKFSYIAAVIAKAFVIVGLVVSILVAVICFAVFGDSMKAEVAGTVDIELDCEKFDITYEDIMDGIDEDGTEIKKQSLSIGDSSGNMILSLSDEDFQTMNVEIKDDVLTAKLGAENCSFTMKDVGVLLFVSCIAMIMTIVTISFIEALCKEFRDCTSPFDGKVIKKMQNLAFSLIPWTIISSISNSFVDSFIKGGLQLEFNIDLGVVLVVLIVFVLVYIFKYGAVLQQESDETL